MEEYVGLSQTQLGTPNPYVAGLGRPPFVPDLDGGAEAYGLLAAVSADFDPVVAAPLEALAPVVRLGVGPA
ncbi:MAG: hypothetical protein Kow0092_09050 [Deferrisomatales bacterium]